MFASPLCWQIYQLVSNLTKKKQQSSYNELTQLVSLYGHDARVFLLSCLMDEAEFRENKGANVNKSDVPKLALLIEEMNIIVQMDNYASIVCEAMECCVRDRTKGSVLPKIVEEKFLSNFCRTVKLTLQQQVAIATALTQSEVSSVSNLGVHHLRSKVPEFQAVTAKDLPMDSLIVLVNLFRSTVELNQDTPALLSALERNYPNMNLSCSPTACMNLMSNSSNAATSTDCVVDAASLILDLGYSTTYSVEVLQAVLIDSLPLQPNAVARLLLVFSGGLEGFDHDLSPMWVNSMLPDKVTPVPDNEADSQTTQMKWNLDVVCEFLGSFNVDYSQVVTQLDQPDLRIENESSFQSFVELFSRLAGRHLPVTCLIEKMWKNMDSQMLFLEFAEASDSFSFATVPCGPLPLIEGCSDLSSTPPSDAWLNPNFFRFLLLVGETSYAQRAREIFARGARSCPEVLALVLAMHASEPAFNDTRLHAALTKQVLVPFFLPNSVPGPYVALFLRRLWTMNQEVFLRCCRYAYGVRSDTVVLNHLVTLTSSLSNNGDPLMSMPGHELMVAVACMQADQNKLDLDAWLGEQVTQKTMMAQVLMTFIKKHETAVLHRVMRNDNTSPLTFESLTSILKVLEKTAESSQDLAPLIDQCISRIVLLHPTLKPLLKSSNNQSKQRMNGNVQLAGAGGTAATGSRPASDEIEDMANSYFQKIYTSEQSISDVIDMLKRFKVSENQRENEIFACMIHNLFDEYRFFHKYPEKELRITGILFGTLIQHQLVSNITLGIALRYVLEALRKPSWQNGKMFRFGMFALEQFKSRLSEWPQYCSHVVQIEYLNQNHRDLVDEVRRAMNSGKGSESGVNSIDKAYESDPSSLAGESGMLQAPRPTQSATVPKSLSAMELPPAPSVMMHGMDGSTTTRVEDAAEKIAMPPPTPPPAAQESGPAITPADRGLIMDAIMPAGADPVNPSNPPDSVAERIHLIVNNVSMQNLDQKIVETRSVLEADYLPWFGNYLVVKRISTQPNFHQLYMAFLLKLDATELFRAVLTAVFHNVSKLLYSAKITTSTSERSLLKNLGSFLGQMTLARNKPILQRKLDVKELLCQGYETGRLIAVTPFVAKIMEGAKDCRVFRPPNPWIMSLMGVLRELYDLDDLKMNIKFEIEVLCKHLGLKIDDVVPQRILCLRLQPRKDKTPDFNVRPSPTPQREPAQQVESTPSSNTSQSTPFTTADATPPTSATPEPEVSATSAVEAAGDQTVIPNLGAYVTVSAQLVIFQQFPNLKSMVPVAVDRAIREIIQPVVERSVTIACITTKELVVKDFALEPNEQKMRKAAQLMVSNLAGSLAVVTCKEPLRLSMANHLRTMLQQAPGVEAIALEHAVQTCSTDNLELGCMLIEKAATEAAIRDMEESLAAPLAERRTAAAHGQPFVDEANAGKRYPAALPEMLRPSRQGLTPTQMTVYDAFARHPRHPPMSGASARTDEPGPLLDAQQAIAAYGRLIEALETSISSVSKKASGRHITLTMLGSDHEVTLVVRQILEVAPKIAQADRETATYQFARSIFFKKIMEADELLKLETFVTILGGLKDECKTMCKDVMGWISYLPVNDEVDCKLHRATLILLVRAKVCHIQELDMHVAVKMNGGAALLWVEFAMMFVRQCVVERVGLWSDFGNIFDMLGKAAQRHGQARKVNKFMEDLRALAQQTPQTQLLAEGAGGSGNAKQVEAPGARDQVTFLLERWIRLWNESGGAEQKCAQFVTLLHQENILKTEEMTNVFLRIGIELCVDACVKTASTTQTQQADGSTTSTTTYAYKVIDALSNMLVILVKYGPADPQSVNSRVQFLNRILATLNRVLITDATEASANQTRRPFDQRPYFRVMINLLRDLNTTDPVVEQNNLQILGAFANGFHNVQPAVVPQFAFAWLELISHRNFMPALLLAKPAQKGWVLMHRILIDLFVFMEPFLRRSQLPPSIRTLYKGTLRVLLVLLHDFPEFLSDYHLSFCDVIPPNCIQLRNLFLSAFPRAMRLPDPFTPNLKVDQLPEIAQHPRILSNFVAAISSNGLRQDLDSYLKTQQPKSFLEWLPDRLRNGDSSPGAPYNVLAINSLVVYVGSQGILLLQSKNLTHSPVMEIFQSLMTKFDAEGRYHLLNAIANQLRYPNSHTHYFSCVLLFLFAETKNEVAKEQITRVLLERLIVHRPHPWGLLITFIELIKNARYNFWAHNFTHCSPEIEKVFESVARSCMGPGHAGITASPASNSADQSKTVTPSTTPTP